MELKETLEKVLKEEILPVFYKRPDEIVEPGTDFDIYELDNYLALSDEDQKDFMRQCGYIMAAAEKMGMVFRNEIFNAYQRYIYNDDFTLDEKQEKGE